MRIDCLQHWMINVEAMRIRNHSQMSKLTHVLQTVHIPHIHIHNTHTLHSMWPFIQSTLTKNTKEVKCDAYLILDVFPSCFIHLNALIRASPFTARIVVFVTPSHITATVLEYAMHANNKVRN